MGVRARAGVHENSPPPPQLEALEHIHSAGVLYKDLKPENLMLGRGDKADTLYVVDFGCAQRFKVCPAVGAANAREQGGGGEPAPHAQMAMTGELKAKTAGTPTFMSLRTHRGERTCAQGSRVCACA